MEQIIIKNLSEMQRFAIQIANELRVHDNISFLLLKGGLGAGKTTFTKFLLKELGVQERVTSPTFVIMNQYVGDNDLTINHVDAYRLNNDSELEMYLDEFESSFNIIE
jgi:tRNA threonylcarbamoyladenosine biosynthesis protein TsaE